MSFLRGLFGPPNIGRMSERQDVEGLIKALGYEKDADVRRRAAEALGRFGDSRAVEPLLTALRNEEYAVQLAAAKALQTIGDERAVEPLIAALQTGQNWMPAAAALALGAIRDSRAVEPLVAALADGELLTRSSAAMALGSIGDRRAVEPLIEGLDRRGGTFCARALGEIGDTRAVEPLAAALGADDQALGKAAAEALAKIRTQQEAGGPPSAPVADDALAQDEQPTGHTDSTADLAGAVAATLDSVDEILNDRPPEDLRSDQEQTYVQDHQVVKEGEEIVGFWAPDPVDAETKLRHFVSLSLVQPPASYRVTQNEADDRGGFFVMFDEARAPGEADAQYEAAMEADRAFAQGTMAARRGDFQQALRHFEEATAGQPYSPEAWNNKAFALANLNRNQLAISCCDRAIGLNPGYADPWDIKGRCLGRLGKLAEALPVIERYIELAPRNDVHAPRVKQAKQAVRSLRARLGT